MKKKFLLYIQAQEEDCIDEALVVVEEGYNRDEVLDDAAANGIREPAIVTQIELTFGPFTELPANFRFYVG